MAKFYYSEARKALIGPGQTEASLRPQSLGVFRFLLENVDQVVSKESIHKVVWGNISVTNDSITQCIHDIRKVLGREHRALLRTLPKRGYSLSAGCDPFGHAIIQRLETGQPKPSCASGGSRTTSTKIQFNQQNESINVQDVGLTPPNGNKNNFASNSMFGRAQEMSLLAGYWDKARAGSGRLVLLNGKAGIGKSRIVRTLLDGITDHSYHRIFFQCSPYYSDTALYPAMQYLLSLTGFSTDDSSQAKLEKLEGAIGVAKKVNLAESIPLLARLIGIEEIAEARYGGCNLSSQEQRNRTLHALLSLVIGYSEVRPLLLVVEDAHWIDPTTLELIELSLNHLASNRILVLVAARPTYRNSFGGHPLVTSLVLNPLGKQQIRSIVDHITGIASVSPAKLDDIEAVTDGVPLFVEELAKAILTSGDLLDFGTINPDVIDLDRVTLPGSLHDSLMTRLERQHPMKYVAQVAACIGREFDYASLDSLLVLDKGDLDDALGHLVKSELIYKQSTSSNPTYTFKHALVRDAAYDSLPKDQRQEVHATLLMRMESENNAELEILAYHATQAGLSDKAIGFWEQVGDKAASRSAFKEATGHFDRAAMLALSAYPGDDGDRRVLALLVKKGHASMSGWGYAHTKTIDTFNQAREVVERLPGSPSKFPVMYGQWLTANVSGRLDEALLYADQMLKLAKQVGDRLNKKLGHRMIGATEFLTGRFARSENHYRKALDLDGPKDKIQLIQQYGTDTNLSSRAILAHTLVCRGEAVEGLDLARGLVQEAMNGGHIVAITFIRSRLSLLYQTAKMPGFEEFAYQATKFARENRLTMWEGFASCAYGAMLYEKGKVSEAAEMLERGLSCLRESNTNVYIHYYRCYFTACIADMGELEKARIEAAHDYEILMNGRDGWAAADGYRLLAEIDHKYFADDTAATQKLERGRTCAEKQGAALWLLRNSISQAKLAASRDDSASAMQQLQIDVNNFPVGGANLPDFQIAQDLLQRPLR